MIYGHGATNREGHDFQSRRKLTGKSFRDCGAAE
jgi:hypothetical protein